MSKVPAARVIYPERPGPLTRRRRAPREVRPAPRAVRPAPQAVGPAPARLTRRGRVVLTALAALVIGVISMVAANAAQASNHTGPPRAGGWAGIVRITVQPGQSLWTIAEGNDPDADTRVVVGEIQQLNSMSGYVVMPGQVLLVPRS